MNKQYNCLAHKIINPRGFDVYVLVLSRLLKLGYYVQRERPLKIGKKQTKVKVA